MSAPGPAHHADLDAGRSAPRDDRAVVALLQEDPDLGGVVVAERALEVGRGLRRPRSPRTSTVSARARDLHEVVLVGGVDLGLVGEHLVELVGHLAAAGRAAPSARATVMRPVEPVVRRRHPAHRLLDRGVGQRPLQLVARPRGRPAGPARRGSGDRRGGRSSRARRWTGTPPRSSRSAAGWRAPAPGRGRRTSRTPGRGRWGSAATCRDPLTRAQSHWPMWRSQSPMNMSNSRAFSKARASTRFAGARVGELVHLVAFDDLLDVLEARGHRRLDADLLLDDARACRRSPCGTRPAAGRRG